MSSEIVQTAKNNITAKNKICTAIRTALATSVPVPDIDKSCELFDPIIDPLQCFMDNFAQAGGKCVPFEMERMRMTDMSYAYKKQKEIYDYLKYEIEMGQCRTVLNGSPQLATVLNSFNIQTIDSIPTDHTADAVIVYAEHLIARTGSIVLSQKNGMMLYPSIKDLSKNIIVLSSSSCIVPDLKSLMERVVEYSQEENQPQKSEFKFDMMEIIRPVNLKDDEYTPSRPHITLIMSVEQ